MMEWKQSTALSWDIWMADSADGKTGKTGLTLAVTLAKYGDTSFTSIAPTVTEIGNGHYKTDLTTTHMNTLGPANARATSAGADPADMPNFVNIIALDKQDTVRMGLTALPNVASGSAGAIPTTGTGANQIAVDGAGNAKADVNKWLAGTIPAVNVTGVPKVDVVDWLGTAPSAPTVAGIPKVEDATLQARLTSVRAGYLDNLSAGAVAQAATALSTAQWTNGRAALIDNLDAAVSSRLAPTVAARTLDVSAGGEAGVDWANVGTPGATVNLSATTIATVTNVSTSAIAAAVWATVSEGTTTCAQILRLLTGIVSGKATFVAGVLTFFSLDGLKTRATITIDATGRPVLAIGDLS